jgi:hypothetical protein
VNDETSNSDGLSAHLATYLSWHGNIKEVQAHLRPARAITTLDVYVQEIPQEVWAAVEVLDAYLRTLSTVEYRRGHHEMA